MSKHDHQPPAEHAGHHDQRAEHPDRRIEDNGPPSGWKERRKHVERRIPHPEEVDISDDDWERYFTPKAGNHADELAHEAAGDTFETAAQRKGR
ncbi:MAG: hypothetical protein FIB06_03240 [Betaproteobacteria bacterium]|nr:hypothetical protein [Betaproteobacteria bacterium]